MCMHGTRSFGTDLRPRCVRSREKLVRELLVAMKKPAAAQAMKAMKERPKDRFCVAVLSVCFGSAA